MPADTYSGTLGALLMGTGNDNNTWGSNANSAVFQILEDAIANALTSTVTGGTLDLSGTPPPNGPSQVRYAVLVFNGTLASNQILKVPNLRKFWWVQNATSGAFTLTIQTPSGSASTAIPQNSGWQLVLCDGANNIVVLPFNSVQSLMPDGTVSAPPYSNINEPKSGWRRAGTQDWRFVINGVDVLQITGTGAGSPSQVNVLSPETFSAAGAASVNSLTVGSPTGGNLGAGKINATGVFVNGVATSANWNPVNLTTSYALATGDGNKVFEITATSTIAITTAGGAGASTFGAGFRVTFRNISVRGHTIALPGLNTFWLYPDQTIQVAVDQTGTLWLTSPGVANLVHSNYYVNGRISGLALAGGGANKVIVYISTTGSDTANDGLTSGSAFATHQFASDFIYGMMDGQGQTYQVQMVDGQYAMPAGGVTCAGPTPGGHYITFVGNSVSPGNVTLVVAGSGFGFSILDGADILFKDFQIDSGASLGATLFTFARGGVNSDLGNIIFGACIQGTTLKIGAGSTVSITDNCTIASNTNAGAFATLQGPCFLDFGANTYTVLAGVSYSDAFVHATGSGAMVTFDGGSFTGSSAGGFAAIASYNAYIARNGVTPPGTSGTSTDHGGQIS